MYLETKELLTMKGIGFNQTLSTSALGWWWTLWIICSIMGQFVFRYSMKAESIDELTISTVAGIVGNIIGISLALITIKVIKDYSNVESLIFEVKDETEEVMTVYQ